MLVNYAKALQPLIKC